MKKSIQKIILLSILGILLPWQSLSIIEPTMVPTNGSVFMNQTGLVFAYQNRVSDYIATNQNWANGLHVKSLTNFVSLSMHWDNLKHIDFGFELEVPVIITPHNINTQVQPSITKTLKITYDPNTGKQYTQMDLYKFEDGYQVTLYVDADNIVFNVTSGAGTKAQVAEVIRLENQIIFEYYKDFDTNFKLMPNNVNIWLQGANVNNGIGEVNISWMPIDGAEEYEIIWKHIDDYDGNGGTISPSQLTVDFSDNYSQVIIDNNRYRFPMTYERGYLLFSVRGIGRNPNNLEERLYGSWSCAAPSSILGCFTSSVQNYQIKIYIPAHESDQLNWQTISSYAENGKRKDIVHYADGTSRVRQSATRINTDNNVIVGETIYDAQGRAAIEVLPTPTDNMVLRFRSNFNQVSAGNPYDWNNFDIDASCTSTTDPMVNISGASQYYSVNNPDKTGLRAYIPEANGYPFTQVQYTPDLTGRIRKQAGPGGTHYMGNPDHTETKYFFGTPSNEELDPYFGNEVGFAENYKKNMAMDANGQISLSYVDLKGNTIMTSLAGNPPNSMDPLASYQTQNMQIDLLAFDEVDSVDYSLTTQYNILVNTAGNHAFEYIVEGAQFTDGCMPVGTCYDCVYDFKIIVTDPDNCGDTLFYDSTTVGTLYDLSQSPQVLDISCSTPETWNSNNIPQNPFNPAGIAPFTIWLEVGSYTIHKELIVNEWAADEYVNHYLNDPNNTCIKDLQDFLDDALADIDTSGCEVDCDDYLAGIAAGGQPASSGTTPCDTLNNRCEIAYRAMLNDMSPWGQYAKYDPNSSQADAGAWAFPLSILNPNNKLEANNNPGSGKIANWQNPDPAKPYEDPDGTISIVGYYSNGNPIYPQDLSAKDFIAQFKSSWAKSLVVYHPEHCYFKFCESIEDSHLYDARMIATTSYTDAAQKDFMNPTTDPFFSNPPGNSKLNDFVNDFLTDFQGTGYSMWDLAMIITNCPGDPTQCAGQTFGNAKPDEEWATFRALYLAAKEEIQYKMRTKYAIENYCYNECIGADPFYFGRNQFLSYQIIGGSTTGYFDNEQPCANSTAYLYKNKNQRFPSIYSGNLFGGMDLYDGDPNQIIADLADWAEDEITDLCGRCPMEYQMDAFLSGIIEGGYVTGGSPNWAAPGLALPDLKAALNSNFLQVNTSPEGQKDKLTITFSGNCFAHLYLNTIINNQSGYSWQDVTSICCVNLYDYNSSGNYQPFTFEITFSDGTNVVSNGKFVGGTCHLDCPKDTICTPNPVASELRSIWNSLLSINRFEQNTLLGYPPVLPPVPTNISDHFNNNPVTWYKDNTKPNTYKICPNIYTGTVVILDPDKPNPDISPPKGTRSPSAGCCQMTFDFPIHQGQQIQISDIIQFTTLELDDSKADANGDIYEIIITGILQNGDEVKVGVANSCFVLGHCGPDCPPSSNPNAGAIAGARKPSKPQGSSKKKKGKNKIDVVSSPNGNTGVVITNPNSSSAPCYSTICDPPPEYPVETINPCVQDLLALAGFNANGMYQEYLDSLGKEVKRQYMEHCLSAAQTFNVSFKDARHHFTLYYYDQASNLVKTVPPEGVQPITNTNQLQQVKDHRNGVSGITAQYPSHKMPSVYTFNSLNQLVKQKIPDHDGPATFKYDAFGRLIISRNAKQLQSGHYSYSEYDQLNRIIEVGEKSNVGVKRQITTTSYDTPLKPQLSIPFPNQQQDNLRGRVATIAYYETQLYYQNKQPDHSTSYSYDIHGNVKSLVQSGKGIVGKVLEYDYDLISGVVHQVTYQRGKPDQFFHAFDYDADNRLISVSTSPNGLIWENDAFYQYYPYGPMARIELGTEGVQGMDYAYNIMGWQKGMNSGSLQPQHDIGQDGHSGSVNAWFARDAVGFILGYHDNDYQAIGTTSFVPDATGSQFQSSAKELFNGNIRRMTTALEPFMANSAPMGYTYTYDQINRFKQLEAHSSFIPSGNQWNATSAIQDYKTNVTYDGNGNIQTLKRNGVGSTGLPLAMDDLQYTYFTNSNRLRHVADNPNFTNNYPDDIDHQTNPSNYEYDKIGNLIKDAAEGISNIEWNVSGKVTKIEKTNGDIIQFWYDALGNRYKKRFNNETTFYVHDATGNVISTYKTRPAGLHWESAFIYGSKRLGTYNPDLCLPCLPQTGGGSGSGGGARMIEPAKDGQYQNIRGSRQYELSNHLGNVLATISDRKLPQDPSNSGNIEYFKANIKSAQDYYAFGSLMPNRTTGDYRFGFQGQEQDDEVRGKGNSVNYKFRMHDPRLGRFFAVDPLSRKYAYNSTYAFSENKLLDGIELEGLEVQLLQDATQVKKTLIHDPALSNTNSIDVEENAFISMLRQADVWFESKKGEGGTIPYGEHYYMKEGGDDPTRDKSETNPPSVSMDDFVPLLPTGKSRGGFAKQSSKKPKEIDKTVKNFKSNVKGIVGKTDKAVQAIIDNSNGQTSSTTKNTFTPFTVMRNMEFSRDSKFKNNIQISIYGYKGKEFFIKGTTDENNNTTFEFVNKKEYDDFKEND